MELNGLSRKISLYDGQVEVAFLPYTSLGSMLLKRTLEDSIQTEAWDSFLRAYVNVVGCLVGMKALVPPEQLDYRSQGLLAFWEKRTGTATDDYTLFNAVMAADAYTELMEAYTNSRVVLPKADAILHDGMPDEDADPEGSSAGRKRSKRKSSS